MGATKDTASSIMQEEDVAKTTGADGGQASGTVKHGDRAMKLIGHERVVLTEEDVGFDPISFVLQRVYG
jgi:hypothetical protein